MIALPVDQQIEEIKRIFSEHQNLILTASPGAGKTTRIPPALLDLTPKQIWVLEPRRMAAVAAAHRIAEENHWQIGEEIGYQVRFESKHSKQTRLLFLTEALLTRKLMADPDLSDCGVVILDEFHERSIHVDLALGLLKELQMLSRPDLKILVMSATLETAALKLFLDSAPVISVPGRLFEIQKKYSNKNQLMRTDHLFIERVLSSLREHLIEHPKGKDILIFLPGMSEIHRTKQALEESAWAQNLLVLPLSGSLSLEDQLRALRPADRRKVLLSTNVAESSVTVDGVDTVIDSGLAREITIQSKTGFERLELKRISKASAEQRAGRAGRQYPGTCIKLWAKVDELSMPQFNICELQRRDLAETVLTLHKLGVTRALDFSWFESPEKRQLQIAEDFLAHLGALENGQLTELGRVLSEIPLPPRFAKLLVLAQRHGQLALGAELCALLQEKDILRESSGQHDSQCDLTERWEAYNQARHSRARIDRFEVHMSAVKIVEQVARQLMQLKLPSSPKIGAATSLIQDLLIETFSDRICRKRKKESLSALMIGGRGVVIAETSSAKNSEFFVALEVLDSGDKADLQAKKATGFSREILDRKFKHQYKKSGQIVFDESLKSYYFEEWLELWGLPIEDPRRRPAKAEEISELLPQILSSRWSEVLRLNEKLDHWWQRWNYFEAKNSFSSEIFSKDLIRKIFEQASFGETKFEAVATKDLVYFFEAAIDPDILAQFQSQCPSHLTVPSGSHLRIHYHLDKNPHLEVRLQEVFGSQQTPTIMTGSVPITLHLLAPNYRPVQVTSDLSSFWDNIYPEVKRELKTRYPKHSWPDDPRTAPALAKGRPTKSTR